MKILVSWLESWVKDAAPLDVATLAERLTMAGLEVESVEPVAPPFTGVVVGEIVEVAPHPNADKLRLCTVDVGPGEPLAIVCGAPNARVGLKAPCALVGAQLPGGLTIRQAKLRGVASFGMLCSARELGISDDHAGLIELPADAPVGADIRRYLQLDDAVIELKMTPNRADCLSVLGVAREVAALTNTSVTPPWAPGTVTERDHPLSPQAPLVPSAGFTAGRAVRLDAPEACPRYLGRWIRGVDPTRPTPEWIERRLRAAGLRPIHFLVDVTNYVMLELGQPLHAFDAQQLAGDITVRWARDGERLTVLTGDEVTLDAATLVIADAQGPVALAGLMGGLESGVRTTTTEIFLESAHFTPSAIAGRARRYGLNSDAAHRFERGVDPEGCRRALERATALILEIAGGEASEVVVAESPAHLPVRSAITVTASRLAAHLGIPVSADDAARWLEREGVATQVVGETITAVPPSWRFDLAIPEDLAEEVARLIGYDAIPAQLPEISAVMGQSPETRRARHAVRHFLCARGYSEAITYAFVEKRWETEVLGNTQPIALANPIAAPLAVMRSSLIPGLVDAVAANRKRQVESVRLFEIGRCFLSAEPITAVTQDALDVALAHHQPLKLAAIAWGIAEPGWTEAGHRAVDFFDLKGDLEALLAPEALLFERVEHPALHPGRSASVWLVQGKERTQIGVIGELHPKWARHWELKPAPVVFEIELEWALARRKPEYQPLSKQPMVTRDLAFLVPEGRSAAELIAVARAAAPQALQSVWVFDVYQGKGLPEGMKSVALRCRWQHPERTLTDAEIDEAVVQIVDALAAQCAATLRQ